MAGDAANGSYASGPLATTSDALSALQARYIAEYNEPPATPYYAYVATNSGIRRIDIRGTPADPTTPIEAPGDGWPLLDETNAIWLHQSENDGLFVWMRGSNGPTIVGYEPSTGTRKTRSESGTDEPRIDRGGRYVQIAYGNNTVSVWDFQTDTLKGSWGMGQGGSDSEWGHAASLRRRAMSMNARISDPMAFSRLFTDLPSTETGLMDLAGPSVEMPHYANGNWIQPNAALDDQWALFSTYDGIDPTPKSLGSAPAGRRHGSWLTRWAAALAAAFVALAPIAGAAQVLGAHYNTQTDYRWQAYPKQSPDGLYVMFTSDMNGSARTDVFLAELPTSAP